MKKYIAGFRSNNSKKKKKASIYYFLITLLFILGSSKDINDISLYLLFLMTPSLVCNFTAFIKKLKNKKKKEVFLRTLIGYLIALCTFIITTPELNEVMADSQLLSQALNRYNTISLNINKKEENISNQNEEDGNISSNVYEAQLHFINTGNEKYTL